MAPCNQFISWKKGQEVLCILSGGLKGSLMHCSLQAKVSTYVLKVEVNDYTDAPLSQPCKADKQAL